MTGKQRVEAAFQKKKQQESPIYVGSISSSVGSAILGRKNAHMGGGIQQWRESVALWNGPAAHEEYLARCYEDAIDISRKLGLDYIRISYWRMPEKPIRKIDDYTFQYSTPYGGYKIMRLIPELELYNVVEEKGGWEGDPDRLEQEVLAAEQSADAYSPNIADYSDFQKAQQEIGDDGVINGGGISLGIPYEEPWLLAIAERPDLVERYLDAQLKKARKAIPVLAQAGIRYLHGGGDCAGNQGLLYSTEVFQKMLVSRLKVISQMCHQYGLFHLFGTDGNTWKITDALFGEAQVDGYYETDRDSGMNLRQLRVKYPQATLLGGISSRTVHQKSKEEIQNEVLETIQTAKEFGGIIAGCSNLLVPGTPLENVTHLMECLHKYR